MKKVIFSLFLASFLIIPLINAQSCYDSDGLGYYAKGYVNFDNTRYYDNCVNREVLIEGYCENGYFRTNTYYCHEGCENGACKITITTTEPSYPTTTTLSYSTTTVRRVGRYWIQRLDIPYNSLSLVFLIIAIVLFTIFVVLKLLTKKK